VRPGSNRVACGRDRGDIGANFSVRGYAQNVSFAEIDFHRIISYVSFDKIE